VAEHLDRGAPLEAAQVELDRETLSAIGAIQTMYPNPAG